MFGVGRSEWTKTSREQPNTSKSPSFSLTKSIALIYPNPTVITTQCTTMCSFSPRHLLLDNQLNFDALGMSGMNIGLACQ